MLQFKKPSKKGYYNAVIYKQKPDIILGCESHLDSSYNSSEVFPTGFTVIRKERVGGGGGGVFILFIQDLPLLEEPFLLSEVEIIWAKLHLTKPNRYIFAHFIDHLGQHVNVYTVLENQSIKS